MGRARRPEPLQPLRPSGAHQGPAAEAGLAMPPPPSAGVLGTPGAAAPPYKGEGSSPTPSAAAPRLALPRPAPPPDRAGELGIDFEFRPPPFVPSLTRAGHRPRRRDPSGQTRRPLVLCALT
jgi:hypothetical protein